MNINKNLTEFYVVANKIYTCRQRALAQAKLWHIVQVLTLPIFSQDMREWEQIEGFELVVWGNPATLRNKTKTSKPKPKRETHWTFDADRTPDQDYLEFAVNDMRSR